VQETRLFGAVDDNFDAMNEGEEIISNRGAVFIYENYIDFKLTKWL
jgi:hypothetical protein